ncbi:beta-1,3-N-acetylglucosaminyltransferase lunatic fringe isoform X1 [Syngnathus scovelli]|uniref:beta-1,3-N-acetylglucosaminyltransferase lunatic fringe isoform X1 n=1 Tax=Syngnathus scovelli TaxID=161590 RepID=UPI00211041F3|nr:beta-1,3-N-acetylglucosaminyltransferase lunatic fringe isoform X1 [Syngnathus scovelli]
MWRFAGEPHQRCSVAVLCMLVAGLLAITRAHQEAQAEGAPVSRAVFTDYFRRLSREKKPTSRPGRSSVPREPGELVTANDVFIAVKTTSKYHSSRLELLLDTWISNNMQSTYVFSDGEDAALRKRMGVHLINTNCSAAHSRQALSCKMAAEYDTFLNSDRKWFCHMDDDNYLNMGALLRLLSQYSHTQDVYIGRPSLEHPLEAMETLPNAKMRKVVFWFATGGAGFCLSRGLAIKMQPWASEGAFLSTAERIRLPDDCAVGYIVGALLGVGLIRSPLFHSHLESLALLTRVQEQVTLSYSNEKNTINLKGPFSIQQDPTRFKSVHCVLHPHTPWCQR